MMWRSVIFVWLHGCYCFSYPLAVLSGEYYQVWWLFNKRYCLLYLPCSFLWELVKYTCISHPPGFIWWNSPGVTGSNIPLALYGVNSQYISVPHTTLAPRRLQESGNSIKDTGIARTEIGALVRLMYENTQQEQGFCLAETVRREFLVMFWNTK